MLLPEDIQRYQRQILLPEIGMVNQERLKSARVLVVGMGGLGIPVMQYLGGAGIGTLGMVDGDKIELHNLARQPVYKTRDIGMLKTDVAGHFCQNLNPDIQVFTYPYFLTPENIRDICQNYDIIIDGTDSIDTRYLLDDYCSREAKTFVYGSVYKFEGQVALFNFKEYGTRYESVFPRHRFSGKADTCNQTGIMGMMPAIIGSLQALETVKYICKLCDEFFLIYYNAFDQIFLKSKLIRT